MTAEFRKKIGVLMGGSSSERDVSLRSGQAVCRALKAKGWRVKAIDIISEESAPAQIEQAGIEMAFIALHGDFGENGRIQALLESLGIPYTGSGIRASRLAMDKVASRELFRQKGLPVPEYVVLERGCRSNVVKQKLSTLKFPLVIKPSSQGSSIGLSIVETDKDFSRAVRDAHRYDRTIIIERYIAGREITIGVLDKKTLPVVWLIPGRRFYDFQAKYQKGATLHIVPAPLSEEVYLESQRIGLLAHQALNCGVFSRVDMIIDKDNRPVVLEVNTVPGFTATSLLPMAARVNGIDFNELCSSLVNLTFRQVKKLKKESDEKMRGL